MKYEAKLPKENVNISHEKPLSELFTLLFGVLAFVFVAYKVLDFSLDIAISHLSPQLERKLFKSIGESFTMDLQKDEKLQDLLDKLSKCAKLPYSLSAKIQEDESSNAFAYPGGQIVVFSNLVKTSSSQNSLAFVLSHEIGHFKNKDHLRAIGKNTLLSFLFALVTNGDGDAVLSSAKNIVQMQYSQSHESQADETALELLNCHYGHVGGAEEFFKSIQKEEKSSYVFGYLSSHPQTKKRIEHLQNLAKEKGYKSLKTIPMWK